MASYLEYVIAVGIISVFAYLYVRGVRASKIATDQEQAPQPASDDRVYDQQRYLNDKIMVYLYLAKHPDHTPDMVADKLKIPLERAEYLCSLYAKF